MVGRYRAVISGTPEISAKIELFCRCTSIVLFREATFIFL